MPSGRADGAARLSTTSSRIAPLLPALLALAAAACAAGGQSGAPPDGTAAAPVLSPAAATALIEWRRPATLPGVSAPPAAVPGSGPATAPGAAAVPGPGAVSRQRVTIDLGGLWVGPDDPREGPRVHYLFARRRRTEDLAQFVRDYAPFRTVERSAGAAGGGRDAAGRGAGLAGLAGGAGTPDQASELVFRGRGAVQASAAERRMIGEWTRAVAVEAVGDGGSPSPYGLAFAWHRGAASGGVCDDLVVYLTGEVRAGSCGAGAEVGGRLAGERLQRLYTWIDGLAAFQDAGEQELRAGALLDRLIFAGRGRQRASPGEMAAIETFAGSLHRELTAAAPAPTVEGPAATRIAAAAAVPKAALPPPREVPTDEEAAADAEANAPSSPAETVGPPRPPRPPLRRQADVPDEPEEAPPPVAEERPAAARTTAAPPAPGAAPPPPGEAVSPPRQPSRKRPANAGPAPAPTPAPEASPPPPPAPRRSGLATTGACRAPRIGADRACAFGTAGAVRGGATADYLARTPRKPREMSAATSASTRGSASPPGQAR